MSTKPNTFHLVAMLYFTVIYRLVVLMNIQVYVVYCKCLLKAQFISYKYIYYIFQDEMAAAVDKCKKPQGISDRK